MPGESCLHSISYSGDMEMLSWRVKTFCRLWMSDISTKRTQDSDKSPVIVLWVYLQQYKNTFSPPKSVCFGSLHILFHWGSSLLTCPPCSARSTDLHWFESQLPLLTSPLSRTHTGHTVYSVTIVCTHECAHWILTSSSAKRLSFCFPVAGECGSEDILQVWRSCHGRLKET